jgi:raffinose/stachyose/melibiose transport system permease protein
MAENPTPHVAGARMHMVRTPRTSGFRSGLGITASSLLLIVYFISIAYPLFWMVISSFKDTNSIYADSFGLPHKWLASNFLEAWNEGVSRYFLNSVFVTVVTCFGTVLISALAAYALARFRFWGQTFFLIFITAGLMFSPQVSLIPLYKLMQGLGLYNTYWALILPYVAYRIPLTVLLIRAHFLGIDREFEESAYLDGCSSLGVFLRIIVPLSVPIFLTTIILTAYFAWNEFTFALIFIDSNSLKTIPIGLLAFRDALHTNWGVTLAGLTISALPIIIAFLFMQRWFIRGLADGGLKG